MLGTNLVEMISTSSNIYTQRRIVAVRASTHPLAPILRRLPIDFRNFFSAVQEREPFSAPKVMTILLGNHLSLPRVKTSLAPSAAASRQPVHERCISGRDEIRLLGIEFFQGSPVTSNTGLFNERFSLAVSFVLILVYAGVLFYSTFTHRDIFATPGRETPHPQPLGSRHPRHAA